MRLLNFIILVVSCGGCIAGAQDTNIINLYTKLEGFEAQTGKTIIKAWSQVGTVSAKTAIISVSYRESTEVVTGFKEHGVVIGIKEENLEEYRTVLDYDELESFLEAVDFMLKVDMTVTSLPSFQAVHRTRADLRLLAYNSTRRVGIVHALETSYNTAGNRILLAPDQLGEFKVLMRSAKEKLDGLKKAGA
ncbi:MAG: hypothetical protein ABIR24_09915 [Verrucomicrobiota bacterium]